MLFKGIIPLLLFVCIFSACRKDQAILKQPGTLQFSEDTVYFDTVFTRLPGSQYPRSVNKRFMIRNPYKETVNINARLMGGSNSVYRINIDGRSAIDFKAVEILPEDSAWVFVEATLEPNSLTQPALVRDSIQFETNGNIQYIQLAAYGWDAYYLKDTVFTGNTSLLLTDKPYVIVNAAYVDSGATLNIGPGLHFYSTPNSGFTRSNGEIIEVSALNVFGTLKVNGNKSNPVIFEGDRLDNNYADVPGQWRGIHFFRFSVNNEIKHAVIKNATRGVWVDSLPQSGQYTLVIRNSIIKNISGYGILGLTAKLRVENTVISNCGANTVLMYYGGHYEFLHCSLHSNTRDPHVLANNLLRNDNKQIIRRYKLQYLFFNSIIWANGGKDVNTVGEDIDPNPSWFNDTSGYSYCYVRSKDPIRRDAGTIVTDDATKSPKFIDAGKNNLKLGAGSPAKDKGRNDLGITQDLEEKSRDSQPDMGAYEL